MVNSDQKRHFTIQEKLLICGLLQLFPNIFHIKVRIGVKRDADIGMAHNHLQCLWIHSAFRHVGTEGMSTNMGRDLWELFFIDAVILLADMLKVFLPMQSNHRHPVLVQIEKAAFALNVRLYHGC